MLDHSKNTLSQLYTILSPTQMFRLDQDRILIRIYQSKLGINFVGIGERHVLPEVTFGFYAIEYILPSIGRRHARCEP